MAGIQFIGAVALSLHGQVEAGRFGNDRGILFKARVNAVYIAVQTAGADFMAAVPRIPLGHGLELIDKINKYAFDHGDRDCITKIGLNL